VVEEEKEQEGEEKGEEEVVGKEERRGKEQVGLAELLATSRVPK